MSRDWCTAVPGGIRLTVQITPNAKKSEVIGVLGDALRIRLQAPPIEGKANEALVRYIADALRVPKAAVSIMHGHTGKRKLLHVAITGLSVDAVREAFLR
jgi:uncharacterized protein (TIGR00251 family)